MSGSLLSLLRELARRKIDHIVVGGMAAVLQGAPIVTADVHIVGRDKDKLALPTLRATLAEKSRSGS